MENAILHDLAVEQHVPEFQSLLRVPIYNDKNQMIEFLISRLQINSSHLPVGPDESSLTLICIESGNASGPRGDLK
jgi:hypothetical protein